MKSRFSEPAFPRAGTYDQQNGMSLRDYFAGQALIGLMMSMGESAAVGFRLASDQLASRCYAAADAMLKERMK